MLDRQITFMIGKSNVHNTQIQILRAHTQTNVMHFHQLKCEDGQQNFGDYETYIMIE